MVGFIPPKIAIICFFVIYLHLLEKPFNQIHTKTIFITTGITNNHLYINKYLKNHHTFVSPSAFSRKAVFSYWRKYVHEVLVNRLGGLSLRRKSVVRLTDRPDMTLDVYRGRKTTMQQKPPLKFLVVDFECR